MFNYVATYNDFERRFAEFLDNKADDVIRFAALGTTEQGESGTQFRVDYLKPSGAIGFYHPDWVVVQKTKSGEANWIVETKGRVWESTALISPGWEYFFLSRISTSRSRSGFPIGRQASGVMRKFLRNK